MNKKVILVAMVTFVSHGSGFVRFNQDLVAVEKSGRFHWAKYKIANVCSHCLYLLYALRLSFDIIFP